ncbi:unnamed protein product [Rhizoctonia solani]|uniref:Uncharacterized protein n=1 Tax=Rhizoctonia solani TaxID=456999 RepID=A0A8H2WX44_9AGAM|nr:unnamed protein product [Rhizoctonia solani]
MQEQTGVDKRPKRLVVGFYNKEDIGLFRSMIDNYMPDPLQCVSKHEIPRFDELPLLDQISIRLRLKKGSKRPIDQAVADAYKFTYDHHELVDQVVLVVYPFDSGNLEPLVKAAETLARHLHDGTSPAGRSNPKPRNAGGTAKKRIPIHLWRARVEGGQYVWMERRAEVQVRFPPGIDHIVCCNWGDGNEQGCWTRFGADGGMMSRQIFLCPKTIYWDMWRHCTKHFIYYKEGWIPKWDEHEPVWTRELRSGASGSGGGVVAEGMKPAGMYRHELRKYQDLAWRDGETSMLVWTSYRD